MSYRLVIRRAAEDEIDEAATWYGVHAGLSAEFMDAVDEALDAVLANPLMWPVVWKDARQYVFRACRTPCSMPSEATPSSSSRAFTTAAIREIGWPGSERASRGLNSPSPREVEGLRAFWP